MCGLPKGYNSDRQAKMFCMPRVKMACLTTLPGMLKGYKIVWHTKGSGWPRSLEIRENRENCQNKFPAWKNQGISKFKKKSGNYQGILQ